MRALLISPSRLEGDVCGDDIVTRLLLETPPEGVNYTHFAHALQMGWMRRSCAIQAWGMALLMHSRGPAGRVHRTIHNPPLSYRIKGRLWPDRPDEDIQWLRVSKPERFDLIHAFSYPIHLDDKARRVPIILSSGCGNLDLMLNYYRIPPDKAQRLALRDQKWLRRLRVLHESYNTDGARLVIVPSRYAYSHHVRLGVPEHKLRIVRIGFETPARVTTPSPDQCRFTMVGHQFWRKGGAALLQAFQRLHQRYPEASLTIVSNVDLPPTDGNLAGITVMKRLSRQAIYETIYPHTDVFVLPTLAEGYGMAVVEAMSFGIPTITSNIGALPELVHDGKSGVLVPPDHAHALYDAMEALMLNPTLRSTMGSYAREVFLAEHAQTVTNQALRALYEEVLNIG